MSKPTDTSAILHKTMLHGVTVLLFVARKLWGAMTANSAVGSSINFQGYNLIRSAEGLRLDAYADQKGIYTIGYGHTKGVVPGMKITPDQAEVYLSEDVREVEQAISQLVKVPLNPNQFSALCSFCFNVGVGHFEKSTLLQLLNQNKYDEAAHELTRWDELSGVENQGLLARRCREKDLFEKSMS